MQSLSFRRSNVSGRLVPSRTMARRVVHALGLGLLTATLVGCPSSESKDRLQGAGATFPAPLYKRMVAEYQKLHPDVAIDYQSIGSGGGIRAITDKTAHFCGSDAPLSRKELEQAGGAENIVEIPSCAGGVVPAYNVPGVTATLNFTGKLLADIYLGNVTNWNDPAIATINPDVKLPDLRISPVYRTDGSGTTFIFTNYLCTQSDEFRSKVGKGKQVQWPPGGQGGKGNEGVTAVVQKTKGSLGYVEQGYADNNKLTYGAVQNKDGKFVKASPDSVSQAGAGAVKDMKGHVLAADIWDQPGEKAYPIASFTYLIVYKDLNNIESKQQAQALVDFLWWATHDGQKFAPDLDYAPLAPEVQAKVEEALKTLTYKGEALSIGGK